MNLFNMYKRGENLKETLRIDMTKIREKILIGMQQYQVFLEMKIQKMNKIVDTKNGKKKMQIL